MIENDSNSLAINQSYNTCSKWPIEIEPFRECNKNVATLLIYPELKLSELKAAL